MKALAGPLHVSLPESLPKQLTGESLEKACMMAAEELSLKATPRDIISKEYQLGSVRRVNRYEETRINIRTGLVPAFQIWGIKKGSTQNYFTVVTGLPFGLASSKRIESYLSTVSRYLTQS